MKHIKRPYMFLSIWISAVWFSISYYLYKQTAFISHVIFPVYQIWYKNTTIYMIIFMEFVNAGILFKVAAREFHELQRKRRSLSPC